MVFVYSQKTLTVSNYWIRVVLFIELMNPYTIWCLSLFSFQWAALLLLATSIYYQSHARLSTSIFNLFSPAVRLVRCLNWQLLYLTWCVITCQCFLQIIFKFISFVFQSGVVFSDNFYIILDSNWLVNIYLKCFKSLWSRLLSQMTTSKWYHLTECFVNNFLTKCWFSFPRCKR